MSTTRATAMLLRATTPAMRSSLATRAAAPPSAVLRCIPNAAASWQPTAASAWSRGFSTTPPEGEEKKVAADAAAEAEAEPEADAAAGGEADEAAELRAQITALEEKVKDLNDQTLRALADAENARTIAKRDVGNAKQFAVTSFAKSLLDVADNLTLAVASVPTEELEKPENITAKTLMEGVVMTETVLTKTFGQHGLKKYGEVGEKFDPNLHDALFQMVNDELEVGDIGAVLKCGYSLNDRVIRPAQVGAIKAA
uniref:GrpE protein homolog n=1 Tax=Florenciella parvula TaxID=236787 RepID=A0A7S2CZD9_9STRA|mmetsp:Transcript_7221/g.14984  ORF Transcript_7221/g.14984 Transcript_7221/m.14984 type:complete len:255 (+) Transcript_7221:151-915(+)